jgi:hypothetical protein
VGRCFALPPARYGSSAVERGWFLLDRSLIGCVGWCARREKSFEWG